MRNDRQTRTNQSPVQGVLRAASLELRELRARHIQLTQRIRALRTAVAALHTWQSPEAPQMLAERPFTAQHALSPAPPASVQANSALRRACRIALLGSFDYLSADEVLARIIRRQSYYFAESEDAQAAVAAELHRLAENGEVECCTQASEVKWKRVPSLFLK
jgi:hypothetical protein